MKNKKFIDAFKNYQVSKNLDEKILSNNDRKFEIKHKKFKLAFVFSICLVILLVGTFSVKKTSNSEETGFNFSLNEGVDFDVNNIISCDSLEIVHDLENALNINLLLDNYKINNCMINEYNEKIESVSLELENNVINDVYFDTINISFMSKNCSDETKETFNNVIDFISFDNEGEELVESVYSDKLKTDIYYVTLGSRGFPIFFVYDNVLYRFISTYNSVEEVIGALEKGV